MTKANASTRTLATLAVLAIATAAWLAFAPRQAGGRMSYVVTEGNSMAPRFDGGDLVGVRRAATYDPGDVVAYHSRSLGRVVLHRIVRTEGDRYVLKGDSNSWIDSDQPDQSDILGKEWFTIPGAGKALGWMGEKGKLALAVTIGALAIAAALLPQPRRGRGRGRALPNNIVATLRGLRDSLPNNIVAALRGVRARGPLPNNVAALQRLRAQGPWIAGAGAALSAALVLLTFLPPGGRSEPDPRFRHEGRFDYSAAPEKSVVYPNGKLSTGDPVYLRLIDELDVSFSYGLASEIPSELQGTAGLSAELRDATGWTRRIELSPPGSFTGNEVTLTGRLDLASIKRLVERVQRETGIFTSTFSLALAPEISIEGRLGEQALQTDFSPRLNFQFDALHLRIPPVQSEGSADPTRPSAEGQVAADGIGAARALLGIPISAIRWPAIVAFALCGMAFAAPRRSGQGGPGTSPIPGRYAHLIVPVTSVDHAGRTLVELSSFETLAALADDSGGPILTARRAGRDRYLLDKDGILYSYKVPVETNGRAGKKTAAHTNGHGKSARKPSEQNGSRPRKSSTPARKVGAVGRNPTARAAGARSKPPVPDKGNRGKRSRRAI